MSGINIIKFLLNIEEENLTADEKCPISFIKLPNGVTAKHLSLRTTT